MKRIEFEGKVHEFPADFTDADIASALGGGTPAAPAAQPNADQGAIRAPQSFTERVEGRKSRGSLMPFTAEAVRTGAQAVAPHIPLPKAAQEAIPGFLEGMVPETPLALGANLGTLGGAVLPATGLRALTRFPALQRIVGGALGGEAGGQAEGRSTGTGTLVGGGGALVGEGVGKALPWLRQVGAGGRRWINTKDAERIGGAVGEISPALGGVKRPTDFQRIAEGEGLDKLGQAKESVVGRIEQLLTGKPGTFTAPGRIEMPSLATSSQVGVRPGTPSVPPLPPPRPGSLPIPGGRIPPPTSPLTTPTPRGGASDLVYGSEVVDDVAGRVPAARSPLGVQESPLTSPPPAPRPPAPDVYAGAGGVSADIPITVGRSSMTLRQANDELSAIGDMLHGRRALDPRFHNVDMENLYGQVARDIEAGIAQHAGPAAAAEWAAAQTAYRQGRGLTDLFRDHGVFDNHGMLNVVKLQKMLMQPERAAQLQARLGPENFEKLTASVFRGAPRTEVDRMASVKGDPVGGLPINFDALMQVLRGTNTGFQNLWRVPITTVAPNVGSQYVGGAPRGQIPPQLQTILDMALQRGAGGMADGQR